MQKTISHHPDDATLMSFSAGSLVDALATVVGAHLDGCPVCRREVRAMQHIGAALFEDLPQASLARPTPVMALRHEEVDTTQGAAPQPRSGEVPASLMRLLASADLDKVVWRRLGLGVWHCKLPSARGDLRLLRVAAGRRMPEHGHGGSEITLMLRGSYTDETGTYHPGDIADLDDTTEHTPMADPDVGCICLIASEKPAKFKGLIPRLVQPLTGM